MRLTLNVQGEQLILLPERALFWVDARMLLIADMHCGKAATFRAHSVPVPEGSMEADLERLSGILIDTAATSLAILGDWIHSSSGCTPQVMAMTTRWRKRHASTRIHWIPGNHDKAARDVRAQFDFEETVKAVDVGPFRLQHKPGQSDGRYTLAGHIHPMFSLRSVRSRFPCFHFRSSDAVLPAFGSFTGGQAVQKAAGDRIFLVADGSVVEWKR